MTGLIEMLLHRLLSEAMTATVIGELKRPIFMIDIFLQKIGQLFTNKLFQPVIFLVCKTFPNHG